MGTIIERLSENGLISIISPQFSKEAIYIGEALIKGGLNAIELCSKGEVSLDFVKKLSSEIPSLLIGVGGVDTLQEAKRLVEAGVRFISSYRVMDDVAEFCINKDVAYLPVVSSNEELRHVISLGINSIKIHEKDLEEIHDRVNSFLGVVPKLNIFPLCDISPENIGLFMRNKTVSAVFTKWITSELLTSKQFNKISCISSKIARDIHGFSLLHVGINHQTPEKAVASAQLLCDVFGFQLRERPNSMFAGLGFEMMKSPDLGENGHIAIGVNNIPRALAYLKRKGISILPGTERWDDDGSMRRVYIDLEISGFAFHLRTYP